MQITRALRHRNYRLFFSGQGVSLIGTWITRIATSWLVYRLTGSAFLLGLVGFSGQIPTLLLTPFTGVLVDRWDRHRILIVTQAFSLLQSLALAVLTFTGIIRVVDIGPSIGGLLIATVGEGWCFMADAISYVAVIASLVAMHVTRAERVRIGVYRRWIMVRIQTTHAAQGHSPHLRGTRNPHRPDDTNDTRRGFQRQDDDSVTQASSTNIRRGAVVDPITY